MEILKQLDNKYEYIRIVANRKVNDMHYSDIVDMTYDEQVKLAKKIVQKAEEDLR